MIFLTGSSGCLGRELLGRLLLQHSDQIALLVRAPDGEQQAETKIRRLVEEIFPARDISNFLDKIRVVRGDLELPRFGLGDSEFRTLAADTTEVFHCGATTNLISSLSIARNVNVGGTKNVVDFSRLAHELGNAVRLHHVSTAYVAGGRTGVAFPDELRLDIPFRNAYEQSKAEAEVYVREAAREFHVDICRPSIIVGDSITGQTSAFNVIYIPARMVARGLFRRFPAVDAVPFDVVPMDYVADAILGLSAACRDSGSAFHICAGVGRESTVWEILETIIDTVNKYLSHERLRMPQMMTAEILALVQNSLHAAVSSVKSIERLIGERLNLLRQVLPFIPYMAANPQFDTSATVAILEKYRNHQFGAAPLFSTYAERLFLYCLETNWGRRPWRNPSNFLSWYERPRIDVFGGTGSALA